MLRIVVASYCFFLHASASVVHSLEERGINAEVPRFSGRVLDAAPAAPAAAGSGFPFLEEVDVAFREFSAQSNRE
jgi:hypothetical protein